MLACPNKIEECPMKEDPIGEQKRGRFDENGPGWRVATNRGLFDGKGPDSS